MADPRTLRRLPLLILAMLCLLAGVLAGLGRLGWLVPQPALAVSAWHGPLLIGGFFGAVISLERAVALQVWWAWPGPLLAGLGGMGLVAGLPLPVAQGLLLAASAVLVAGSLRVLWQVREAYAATMAGGALAWLTGNLCWWLDPRVYPAVPWWLGFLLLTIAGERLELSRVLPGSRHALRLFGLTVAVLVVGMTGQPLWLGAGLLGLALWLLRHDVARRTLRMTGLPRFVAVCLLSGYGWLAVAGAVVLGFGLPPSGPVWDAALHAALLGFVFAMVFGHAPIIFPAVLRVAMPFDRWSYLPLAALQLALLVRLGGDALDALAVRRMGGMLSAVALLLFVLVTLRSVLRGRGKRVLVGM